MAIRLGKEPKAWIRWVLSVIQPDPLENQDCLNRQSLERSFDRISERLRRKLPFDFAGSAEWSLAEFEKYIRYHRSEIPVDRIREGLDSVSDGWRIGAWILGPHGILFRYFLDRLAEQTHRWNSWVGSWCHSSLLPDGDTGSEDFREWLDPLTLKEEMPNLPDSIRKRFSSAEATLFLSRQWNATLDTVEYDSNEHLDQINDPAWRDIRAFLSQELRKNPAWAQVPAMDRKILLEGHCMDLLREETPDVLNKLLEKHSLCGPDYSQLLRPDADGNMEMPFADAVRQDRSRHFLALWYLTQQLLRCWPEKYATMPTGPVRVPSWGQTKESADPKVGDVWMMSQTKIPQYALITRINGCRCFIIPFSPFPIPATEDELQISVLGCPGLAVVQLWNGRMIHDQIVNEGFRVGHVEEETLQRVNRLMDILESPPAKSQNESLDSFWNGAPVFRPDDPRIEHRTRSLRFFEPCESADIGMVERKIAMMRFMRMVPTHGTNGAPLPFPRVRRPDQKAAAFLRTEDIFMPTREQYPVTRYWLANGAIVDARWERDNHVNADPTLSVRIRKNRDKSDFRRAKLLMFNEKTGAERTFPFSIHGSAKATAASGTRFCITNKHGEIIPMERLGEIQNDLTQEQKDLIGKFSRWFFEIRPEAVPLLEQMSTAGLVIVRTTEPPPVIRDWILKSLQENRTTDASVNTIYSSFGSFLEKAEAKLKSGIARCWHEALERTIQDFPEDAGRIIYDTIVHGCEPVNDGENISGTPAGTIPIFRIPENLPERPVLVNMNAIGCFECPWEKSSVPTVKLFYPGIPDCAQRLSVSPDVLENVVLIHELTHWCHYMMTGNWPIPIFNHSTRLLKECLAQLLPCKLAEILGEDSEFAEAFRLLNENQTLLYSKYKEFQDQPVECIAEAFLRLRRDLSSDAQTCSTFANILKKLHPDVY